MNITMLISGCIAMLLTGWALCAANVFAPDLFAMLDVSDILSGVALTVVTLVGNVASFKLF